MYRTLSRAPAAVACALVIACTTPAGQAAPPNRPKAPTTLTVRELASFGGMPLDEAVVAVWPRVGQFHGTRVALYIDGRRAEWDELHALRADYVARVRLLSRVEAAVEFGAHHNASWILDVRLR